ncbi:NAD(P)-dependent oxidoreductase [Pseudogemmobacter bohemicus]|uniref:NAD(P)-dependent oxidoreductase n=1 Tax=Pseudogemmobacter bohemicus TaxID=2250708 RepID=UPI000DD42954|nr:NAD(P)-dependent oxidoreductase [Pseudogemmobacter bohemicus]
MTRNSPKILVADLVGLAFDAAGEPDCSGFRAHVESGGGRFHIGSARAVRAEEGRAGFFYMPHLSTSDALIAEAGDGLYDAVIAAATFLPAGTRFDLGGVRIGTGTGNMGSASWGGGDGLGGAAPLMNTPGINARATAQMVMKALIRQRPDLPVEALHALVVAGRFDTGRDLAQYPTRKLEGQRLAVIGYGNIGREVALLARAFGMEVVIHARPRHRLWIQSEGFRWAASPEEAAIGADALSVHLGLGPKGPEGFANAGLINEAVLAALAPGAVLLNYDRGELVDIPALDRALSAGQVGFAAIDADLFSDAAGALSGPMQPYLALVARHGARLSLLPHAAADTDHPTRVAGAIQAADQLLEAIRNRVVRNLKGDLPEGYSDGGPLTPAGLGGVAKPDLARVAGSGLGAAAADFAAGMARLEAGNVSQGEALVLAANRLSTLMREAGLAGPWKG